MNTIEPVNVQCPYCGEWIDLTVDCSIPIQNYIEDCQVCCRPIPIEVRIDDDGSPGVIVGHENDA